MKYKMRCKHLEVKAGKNKSKYLVGTVKNYSQLSLIQTHRDHKKYSNYSELELSEKLKMGKNLKVNYERNYFFN